MPFSTPPRTLSALLLLGLSLASCGSQSATHGTKPVGSRLDAPDFEARDIDNRVFHLSDYKDKVVLLNFWATWCGPCKIEIPWFVDFERTYKDKGFAVIGLSLDDDGWDVVRPYIQSRQVNYRIGLGSEAIERAYAGRQGIESLPTTFLIDRQGKVAAVHVGLVAKKDYQNEIEELIR